jgi:YD repeat-containing protein
VARTSHIDLNVCFDRTSTTTYAGDAVGGVIRTTEAKGQIVNFECDGDGRLQRVDPPGTADDVTLTYDAHGRLVSQATATNGITYGYNAAGQLAARHRGDGIYPALRVRRGIVRRAASAAGARLHG